MHTRVRAYAFVPIQFIRVLIRSYPINSRPVDISLKLNMQMLIRLPIASSTEGSKQPTRFGGGLYSKCFTASFKIIQVHQKNLASSMPRDLTAWGACANGLCGT